MSDKKVMREAFFFSRNTLDPTKGPWQKGFFHLPMTAFVPGSVEP